jgi:hypothetical protein
MVARALILGVTWPESCPEGGLWRFTAELV